MGKSNGKQPDEKNPTTSNTSAGVDLTSKKTLRLSDATNCDPASTWRPQQDNSTNSSDALEKKSQNKSLRLAPALDPQTGTIVSSFKTPAGTNQQSEKKQKQGIASRRRQLPPALRGDEHDNDFYSDDENDITPGAVGVEAQPVEEDEDTVSNGNEPILEGEVAPDYDEEVGQLQQRVLDLQQAEQGRENTTAVLAVVRKDEDEEDTANKRRRYAWYLFLIVALAAIGAGAGIALGSNESSDAVTTISPTSSTSPTMGPTTTQAPTVSPTLSPTTFRQFRESRRSFVEASLADMAPFHSEAFQWLTENDSWLPPDNATDPAGLLRERYVLAIFYFDTSGGPARANWLTPVSICEWVNLFFDICNEDQKVATLSLPLTDVVGTLPTELGSLTDLSILDLTNNIVEGSIPSELGFLTKLEVIAIGNDFSGTSTDQIFWGNEIEGKIPSEIGKLTSLFWLDISYNNLSGEIPAEISKLTNLRTFNLEANELNSTLSSTFFTNMTRLETIRLGFNYISGAIPQVPSSESLSVCSFHSNCFSNLTDGAQCQTFGNPQSLCGIYVELEDAGAP